MSSWAAQQPDVGQSAERSRRVTSEDIELFTAISGDRNPLHYDQDVAAKSRFGAVIVQGGIMTAILTLLSPRIFRAPARCFFTWTGIS